MPLIKKDKKRQKPKPKQKQKQKQVVKQNVKVTVQSSGGSGGGGSSVPSAFSDRSGENVRLQNLVEQLSRRISAPVSSGVSAPAYNPANDADTFKSVYNAPIDYNKPIELGNISSAKLGKEMFSRMPPSQAYSGLEAPSGEEKVSVRRRKDIGKQRGSYKERAIIEGRNIQNIFALGEGGITGGGSSQETSSMFSEMPQFVGEK